MKKMKISRRNFMGAAAASGVLLMAGCATDSSSTSTSASTATSTTSSGSTTEEIPTVTIGIQISAVITDYKDNYLTRAIEEDLGINLEFYEMPSATSEFSTKFSLMATNQTDMPDLVFCMGALTSTEVEYYGQQGIIAPITSYLEDPSVMVNYNALDPEDKATLDTGITASDGNIYGMPTYNPHPHSESPNRLFVNQEWLDTLDMPQPTTTDEFADMLAAFKSKDPNGNGKQDEIPMYGLFTSNYGMNSIWSLMNSFEFYNEGTTNNGLALNADGSTIIAPFVQDGWRKGLDFMNGLYEDGLLSPAMFTDDDTLFKATLNAETPVVGFSSVGSTSNWTDCESNPNYLAMDIINPMEGPDGIAYSPYKPTVPTPRNFLMSAAKNPDAAMQVMDWFFTLENSRLARYGLKDVHWTDDPAVTALYSTNIYDDDGNMVPPTVVVDLDPEISTWSDANNFIWRNANPLFLPNSNVTSAIPLDEYDPEALTQKIDQTIRGVYAFAHPDFILPSLVYTPEETEVITVATAEIATMIYTSTAEFITGSRSLDDAGWEAYLKEMDALGLQTCIETAQQAYNRMK